MIRVKRLGSTLRGCHPPFCKLRQMQRTLLHSVTNADPVKTSNPQLILRRGEYQLVISGISGRFPQSDSMEEFRDNLFSKRDMVEPQNKFKTWNVPGRFGCIKNADKFDAQFFGISPKLANYMDPQSRKLLEVTFEAIIDAGINPGELQGSSTGVFVGALNDDSAAYWAYRAQANAMEGYGAICANYSLANRISFAFDVKGPSYMLSSGCSASLVGIEAAVHAIHSGSCDAAIVAGCSIHLSPMTSMDLAYQVGALGADGMCKAFDAAGDGFVRSEAISAILIQKQEDAKRVYCSIKSVQSSSDGFKHSGFTFPSGLEQEKLFTKIYTESEINPGKVKYIEMHGTGTPIGDIEEIKSVSRVFCNAPSRTEPLLIGSVKSNMGHAESAAGHCGIAKVIIAIQEGQIPPNLHFNQPRKEFEHLFDGSVQALHVVTEATPFTGGLIGASAFGIGGTNAHLVIEAATQNPTIQNSLEVEVGSHEKCTETKLSRKIPTILPFSGRTEDAVTEALGKASEKSRVENPEFCGLIHNIFKTNVKGHPFRGFVVYNPSSNPATGLHTLDLDKNIQVSQVPFEVTNGRPICFVFSGLGSQWNEMGLDLQRIDVFRESLRKSKQTLKNVGVDLEEALKPNNPNIFKDAQVAAPSIAAIQIALYETLISLKILPAIFLGHSIGEILCGYADGSFTAEEALLFEEALGRASNDFKNSPPSPGFTGAMANVEMSWDELASKLPPNVYLACKNSKNNTTISGESTAIESLVKQLNNDGILAGEINSCGAPVHSPLIHSKIMNFIKYASDFFPKEKKQRRSEKWISSSIPPEEWGSELAKYNSIAYHANSLKFPVFFHDAVQEIPENATVIEIAPKGLLLNILKGSVSSKNFVIAPMSGVGKPKSVAAVEVDKVSDFLTSVGKIYNSGVNVDFSGLYAPVSFPVPASTPGLSSLVKWNHKESWTTPLISNVFKDGSQGMTMTVDLSSQEHQFLNGHKLDGRCIFPASGYLWLVWRGFACHLGVDVDELPIVLENVEFKRATLLKAHEPVEFRFTVSHSSGVFEVKEENAVVARGNVRKLEGKEDFDFTFNDFDSISSETFSKSRCENGEIILQADDIYKEIRLRGQELSGEFRGIHRINTKETCGEIRWNNNWIAFLDSVLQLTCTCLGNPTNRYSMVPVRIQKIKIDPSTIHAFVNKRQQKQPAKIFNSKIPILIPVKANQFTKVVSAPGLELQRLTTSIVSRKRQDKSLLAEEYRFSAYFDDIVNVILSKSKSGASFSFDDVQASNLDTNKTIQVSGIIDLVVENTNTNFQILDVFTTSENSLSEIIYKSLKSKPRAKANIKLVSTLEEIEKLDEPTRMLGTVEIVKLSDLKTFSLDLTADIIFLDDNNKTPLDLTKISSKLKENSFLVIHSQSVTKNIKVNMDDIPSQSHIQNARDFENKIANLVKISEKHSVNLYSQEPSTFKLEVFKKTTPYSLLENGEIKSLAIDGKSYDWLPKLQELMTDAAGGAKTSSRSRIYLTSQNDPFSGIVGLFNCLREENKGANLRCIFDPEKTLELKFDKPNSTLSDIIEKDLVMNVVKGGKLGSYRRFPLENDISLPHKKAEHAYVNALTLGDLTSLRWIESPLKYYRDMDKSETLCKVHYAALNFLDIMLSSGKLLNNFDVLKPDSVSTKFGFEFSGIDGDGRRVMGMVSEQALATSVLASSRTTWEIPDHWTLEEAATVPVVYVTAYYALYDRGQLKPGQSILIHSGTGGMGQASIHLAVAKGCQIYTTVGNEEKRNFIKSMFPALPDENIFSSRDCHFETRILERTKGKGVDLVLNSLSGDKLLASVRCVADGGKFLEIGKNDLIENTVLGMSCLLKNIDFQVVDARAAHQVPSKSTEIHPVLLKFQRGMENGDVKPLKRSVFNIDQVEEAFRFMANGKHIGKVVIKVRDENGNSSTQDLPSSVSASAKNHTISKSPIQVLSIPQTYFHSDKTYIIAGGLGGLGFETAIWLAQRRAKKVILTSRSGGLTGYHKIWLKYLAEHTKVELKIVRTDLSRYEAARDFFENLSKDGEKVGGIFNSCLVLQDALIEDQTVEMFQAVAGPKVSLTKNLDQLTREFYPELDYFVVFSSLASGNGNAGQTNYAMANNSMEQICEKRKVDGLHGLAIQWGPIGEVGYLVDKMESKMDVASFQGTVLQSMQSCLEVLNYGLNQGCPVLSSTVLDELSVATGSGAGILQTFSRAFGIKDLSSIHPNTKLIDLGIDSLIGIEIKQALERDYDLSLTPLEIRRLTFANLLAVEAGTFTKGNVKKSV